MRLNPKLIPGPGTLLSLLLAASFTAQCATRSGLTAESAIGQDSAAQSSEQPANEQDPVPQPAARPGVAVVPFVSTNADASPGSNAASESSETTQAGERKPRPSVAGTELAAQILARLGKARGLKLVERGQLTKVLEELALAESGALLTEGDGSRLPQIGRLLGAEYLVLGRVTPLGEKEKYSASLRLVRAKSGVVIGTAYGEGSLRSLADELAAETLRVLQIYLALENPTSPYSVLIKLKGGRTEAGAGKHPVYRLGDQMRLEFKVLRHREQAPRQVYIQLYSIDAHGVLTLIYPNKFAPQARIEVDRVYSLPGDRDDFEWILTEPVGDEKIQAIVTTKPLDFFQLNQRYQSEAFPSADRRRFRDDLRTFRGIVTRIKKEKLKDWSAERVSYRLKR